MKTDMEKSSQTNVAPKKKKPATKKSNKKTKASSLNAAISTEAGCSGGKHKAHVTDSRKKTRNGQNKSLPIPGKPKKCLSIPNENSNKSKTPSKFKSHNGTKKVSEHTKNEPTNSKTPTKSSKPKPARKSRKGPSFSDEKEKLPRKSKRPSSTDEKEKLPRKSKPEKCEKNNKSRGRKKKPFDRIGVESPEPRSIYSDKEVVCKKSEEQTHIQQESSVIPGSNSLGDIRKIVNKKGKVNSITKVLEEAKACQLRNRIAAAAMHNNKVKPIMDETQYEDVEKDLVRSRPRSLSPCSTIETSHPIGGSSPIGSTIKDLALFFEIQTSEEPVQINVSRGGSSEEPSPMIHPPKQTNPTVSKNKTEDANPDKHNSIPTRHLMSAATTGHILTAVTNISQRDDPDSDVSSSCTGSRPTVQIMTPVTNINQRDDPDSDVSSSCTGSRPTVQIMTPVTNINQRDDPDSDVSSSFTGSRPTVQIMTPVTNISERDDPDLDVSSSCEGPRPTVQIMTPVTSITQGEGLEPDVSSSCPGPRPSVQIMMPDGKFTPSSGHETGPDWSSGLARTMWPVDGPSSTPPLHNSPCNSQSFTENESSSQMSPLSPSNTLYGVPVIAQKTDDPVTEQELLFLRRPARSVACPMRDMFDIGRLW